MFFPGHLNVYWYSAAGAYAGSLFLYLFRKERLAVALLLAGFVLNTLFLAGRSFHWGFFVPTSMFSETFFLPWCLVLLVGISCFFDVDNNKSLLSGLIPIVFFSLMALLLPDDLHLPSARHQTVFAPLFLIVEVIAYACFILGGWLAFWGMIGKGEVPIFNGMIVWGFVFYSLAQIVGGIWAFLGWGLPFHWSEKHLQSASLWCFYCAYLHLAFSSRWKMGAKRGFAVIGTVMIVVFNYACQIK